MLPFTIGALVLGIVFGFLMNGVLPQAVANGISTYLLNPLKTMFMNALQSVIGPVIFFSMVSCISQFKDLRELGRIALKIVGLYTVTTVLAVVMGLGIAATVSPGEFGFALTGGVQAAEVSVNTNAEFSLLNTIVGIVPSNFVQPFVEANMLQILFLGVLCGIAVGMIGKYSPVLQEFFEACNSLFVTVTTMITRFIPLAVICSCAMMTAEMGGTQFLPVFGYLGTILLAFFSLLVMYGLLVLVLARVNPLTFYRKNKEGMLTGLTLSSSSAAVPTNMKICTEKMGIAPTVSAFSIPLGATINMDGFSMKMIIRGHVATSCSGT